MLSRFIFMTTKKWTLDAVYQLFFLSTSAQWCRRNIRIAFYHFIRVEFRNLIKMDCKIQYWNRHICYNFFTQFQPSQSSNVLYYLFHALNAEVAKKYNWKWQNSDIEKKTIQFIIHLWVLWRTLYLILSFFCLKPFLCVCVCSAAIK